MSIIGNIGEQFDNSIEALRIASAVNSDGQRELAIGESLLRGLAQGSSDPDLQKAIDSYAAAIQKMGELAGQITLIGDRIFTIADRMGHLVDRVPEARPAPEVTILGILEPAPVGGDRGNTTPEQFRSYEQKEESVNRLIDLGVDPTTIEGHIAQGGTCQVYRTADGKIIKLPVVRVEDENDEEENEPMPPPAGTAWYGYAEALKAAQGEPALEQYVAYIDDRGVPGRGATVSEAAPGVTADTIYSFAFDDIPPEQLDVLMQGFQALERHGLLTDSELDNFMYDPEKGFTIIDYGTMKWHLRKYPRTEEIGRAHKMASSFLESACNGVGEIDVAGRMSEMRGFINNYTDAYDRAFGAEATEKLRETIRAKRKAANEREDKRRRGY